MNLHRSTTLFAFLLAACVAGPVHAQAGSGNLYRVTSKMEIDGMPIQMPSRAVEVCGPKNQASEKMVPSDENCTVSDFRVAGNKSSFKMTCRGENPMTATGEFEQLGPDAYRGRMKMQTTAEGEPMSMTMNFEGKKIRDCDYATESPEAQGRAMLAKTCEAMLANPDPTSYQSFVGADAVCPTFKTRYCNAMLAKALTPESIRSRDYMLKNSPAGTLSFWDAFAACGTSRQAALAKTCPMAEKTRDYEFLTGYCPALVAKACAAADVSKEYDFVVASCPAQAQAAAAKHCAGRDFTAMRMSPYANFCSRYAAGSLQQRNAGAAGPAPAPSAAEAARQAPPPAQEEAKKPSLRDRLKAARDKLTGGN